MAQEKISANESTPTFQTFEGALFCVWKEGVSGEGTYERGLDLRERSCLLRCSLRLKARLQNWHLYFFSGAEVFLAGELLAVPGAEGAICVWASWDQPDRLRREAQYTAVVWFPE